MDLKTYLGEKRAMVDEALGHYMPEPQGYASELIKAMDYSLSAGGKRLRPVLCIAAAEAVGGNGKDVMPVACALELIHTYSLIHDDLPAMDNDDLRRGKPTNHKVFGEAMAILAGDALLTEAFFMIAMVKIPDNASPTILGRIINIIAGESGWRGMVGGQAVDMQSEGKVIDASTIDYIHSHKTGALIAASVSSGAVLAGGTQAELDAMEIYGKKIGLAFQISDDILDIEGNAEVMGKGVGGDMKKGKNTFPSVYGLSESRLILRDLVDSGVKALEAFDHKADPLRQIAQYIIERKN
jgi:geranylgeranyl diphosphate synthase, type II